MKIAKQTIYTDYTKAYWTSTPRALTPVTGANWAWVLTNLGWGIHIAYVAKIFCTNESLEMKFLPFKQI